MIMCSAVGTSSLDAYEQRVKKFATLYGHEAWGLLYQADHWARLEQIDRVCRKGALSYDAAQRALPQGATLIHDFDPPASMDLLFRQIDGGHSIMGRPLR